MEELDNDITCVCKEKIVKYYVAVLPNGEEVEIRGIAKSKLKDGMKIIGQIKEDEVQDKYSDGSYARSMTIHRWLQIY